jgi:hypothetical protein
MRTTSGTVLSRLTMEVAASCFTMTVGAVVTFGSLEFGTGWGDAGPQPGYFPFYVGIIVILASLGVLIQAVAQHRDRQESFLTREQGRRILSFFGPMLAFVVLSVLLGLYVALTLYLIGVMTLQGGYRPLKAVFIGVSSAVIFYVVFEIWFQVPLLKGPLEALLNIH